MWLLLVWFLVPQMVPWAMSAWSLFTEPGVAPDLHQVWPNPCPNKKKKSFIALAVHLWNVLSIWALNWVSFENDGRIFYSRFKLFIEFTHPWVWWFRRRGPFRAGTLWNIMLCHLACLPNFPVEVVGVSLPPFTALRLGHLQCGVRVLHSEIQLAWALKHSFSHTNGMMEVSTLEINLVLPHAVSTSFLSLNAVT